MFEDLPGRLAIHLVRELGVGKLAGPVNAHKERACPPPSEVHRYRCGRSRSDGA
jgi:hypothetical protein